MKLGERFKALDRAVIGPAYDERPDSLPAWATWAAAAYPMVTAAVAFAAFGESHAAGVGVLVGLVLSLPVGLLAHASARRQDRK